MPWEKNLVRDMWTVVEVQGLTVSLSDEMLQGLGKINLTICC